MRSIVLGKTSNAHTFWKREEGCLYRFGPRMRVVTAMWGTR
jgi:hypothetical protein